MKQYKWKYTPTLETLSNVSTEHWRNNPNFFDNSSPKFSKIITSCILNTLKEIIPKDLTIEMIIKISA